MLICERCGAKVFLKCVGEGELDGGFTHWDKFEPEPAGWEYHNGTGKLCTNCERAYKKMIEKFNKSEDTE